MSESERVLFDVPAVAYDRLMGRYLPTLAPALADAAGVASGSGRRVLDVGCGPGGLTRVLVERVGPGNVVAIDPSPPFVAACAERNPGVDVREGVAEQLPFDDDAFDASLASLVIGFMTDPHAGVAEMRRVTHPGGRLALSFWTLDTMPVLSTFWRAAGAVTGATSNDDSRFGRRDGEIAGVLRDVGATDVEQLRLTCRTTYADVDDFFSSFTGQAGPVGVYLASLPETERDRVRDEVDRLLGHPRSPFTLEPVAWCGVGTA